MKSEKPLVATGPPMLPPPGSGIAQILKEVGSLVKSFGRDRAALVLAWVVGDLVAVSAGWMTITIVQVIFGLMFYVFRRSGVIAD
jgi:hypothetical protein